MSSLCNYITTSILNSAIYTYIFYLFLSFRLVMFYKLNACFELYSRFLNFHQREKYVLFH